MPRLTLTRPTNVHWDDADFYEQGWAGLVRALDAACLIWPYSDEQLRWLKSSLDIVGSNEKLRQSVKFCDNLFLTDS